MCCQETPAGAIGPGPLSATAGEPVAAERISESLC